AMVKPYVLMAISVAAAVFYVWSRFAAATSAALKPFSVIVALALGSGGLVLGSRYLEKRGGESGASTLASQRQAGYGVEGGSNFNLDGPSGAGDVDQRSWTAELALAPFALFTALFRPLLFEARNAVQLANALESTTLFVIALLILRRLGWAGTLTHVRRSPTLMFCFVFTLALGLGTGLASTNLGTLSRYRAPMMPFFFTLLLVLRAEAMARLKRPVAAFTPADAAR
ncbi:MAG: hypothetical protein HY906_03810, partial [Deltaproteobacteria bacterium]|nr:hypothetical protein [Deltaproteobacteria bacterium]